MSEILRFVDFSKAQKSKYLMNETFFSLQIKCLFIIHFKCYNIVKNSFLMEEHTGFVNPSVIKFARALKFIKLLKLLRY